jgi:ferredoxin
MRVTVDRKRCESHGFCADAAPAVFSLDDESDDLVVADGPVEPDLETDVHAAVRVCPVAARGSFDAIGDLAEPFPVGVIMDMIGFPGDHRVRILQWADAGFHSTGPADERCLAAFPLLQQMFEYLLTLTEDDF